MRPNESDVERNPRGATFVRGITETRHSNNQTGAETDQKEKEHVPAEIPR